MKIAVNTRLLLKDKMEGIGWYAFEVLKRITSNQPNHQFYFLFDRNYDKQFIFSNNIIPVIIYPQARHPILYRWWFERSIPQWCRRHKPDILFSPEGYLSLKSNVPSVNVIHDLNFEHHPQHVSNVELRFYKKYFPKYAVKANEIITVSEFSKRDITSLYKIPPQKINVIYNGIRETFGPISDEEKKKARDKFSDSHPYFIYLGSIHPRKNIEMLLKAFDDFSSSSNGMKLVISGRKFKKSDQVFREFESMKFKDRVVFHDYVAESEINSLVAGAEGMIYIPLFEGFGLPIIEAFRAQIPVITSNVTSIPEVAGDAAILVDPNSKEEIVHSMQSITNNQELRSDLIQKGKDRAKNFSWDTCATKTWNVIERNLG